MKRIIILWTSALLSVACAQTAPVVKSTTAQKTISQQEVLQNLAQVRTSNTYTLQPGDLVEIKVFQEDNMSRIVRVDGNSKISFPLVGTISVKDCSLEMAEQRLVSRLKDYIKSDEQFVAKIQKNSPVSYWKPAYDELQTYKKSLPLLQAMNVKKLNYKATDS